MTPALRHDRGTLVMREVPGVVTHLFTWDARSQLYRARGQHYREISELLRGHLVESQDEAAAFQKLELGFGRAVTPYSHQVEALAAWKRAGRQGTVVLPTGAGKTLLAQLAMRDTPRSTLICVPTLDLLQQWYSGLLSAFPDASIGLLGGGSKDETPVLVSTYDSAVIHAEELARKYGLLIFDEAHHLPSDHNRAIAEMSLAPYRLGLTATVQRSDGREVDLD
ncbi:MAG: DEAD/DEAH box helicase family protein, partial [Deinococcus sp.]